MNRLLPAVALFLATACSRIADAPTSEGDPGRGYAIASARCQTCHGGEGKTPQAGVPSLNEQWPEYLVKQLRAFAASPNADNYRQSAIMGPTARSLSERDRADVAAWYSLEWRPPAGPRDANSARTGRVLFLHGNAADNLPACASCHRVTGLGIRPDFPNIAGQDPVYIEHQLTVWEATRGHPGKLMTMIIPHLRADERAPLADYVASLKSRPIEGRD